jgi:hypothetical protein
MGEPVKLRIAASVRRMPPIAISVRAFERLLPGAIVVNL